MKKGGKEEKKLHLSACLGPHSCSRHTRCQSYGSVVSMSHRELYILQTLTYTRNEIGDLARTQMVT